MKEIKKEFDCVEMMHKGALRIYRETKNMTIKQKLAYWQKKTEELMAAEKAAGHEVMLVREPSSSYRTSRTK